MAATLNIAQNQLHLNGREPVHLTPREADVLAILARSPGEVVTRRTLIEEAWSGNHLVGEQGLSKTIHSLRAALEDDPRQPSFIRTVPRQGYQLVGRVDFDTSETDRGWRRTRRARKIAATATAAVVFVLVLIVFAGLRDRPVPAPDFKFPRPVLDSSIAEIQPSLGGSLLAVSERASSDDPTGWDIRVRSWPELALVHAFETDADELAPSVSPDGSRIAYFAHTGDECVVRVFDFRLMEQIWQLACEPVPAARIGWTEDGRRFFHVGATGLREADVARRLDRVVAPARPGRLYIKPDPLADGRVAVLEMVNGRRLGGFLVILDAQSGAREEAITLPHWASDFEFHEGSLFIGSGRPGNAGIWSRDIDGWTRLSADPAFDLVWDEGGLLYARGIADIDLCLTDRSLGPCKAGLSSSASEFSPVFLGSGERLAFLSNRGGENRLHVQDTDTGKALRTVDIGSDEPVSGPFPVSESAVLLAVGKTVQFHRIDENISFNLQIPGLARVLGVLEGRFIVYQSEAADVRVYDADRGNDHVVLPAGNGQVFFDPHNGLLHRVSANGDHQTHAIRFGEDSVPWAVRRRSESWPPGRPLLGGSDQVFVQRRLGRTDLVNQSGEPLLSLPDEYSVFGLDLMVAGERVVYERMELVEQDIFFLEYSR